MSTKLLSSFVVGAVGVAAHAQLVLPFSGTDASATVSAFQIIKSGSSGRANTLYITNTTNTSDVLLINTVGLGRAIYAWINNASNGQPAIRGDSNGSGISVFGYMTGTGRAGSFRISNISNGNNALHVQTNGAGDALYVDAGSGRAANLLGGVRISDTGSATFGLDVDGALAGASIVGHTQQDAAYIYNYGQNGIDTAIGVNAGTGVTNGTAVFGISFGTGLYGLANGNSGKGTVGQAGMGGFGLYAFGNTGATGTKSFQIDHPLDPANSYLQHYCSEGPEPLNVYSGLVTTDARGYARVQLPDYFGSINKEPRYQLTVLDSSDDFVMAKIVQEIAQNSFVVRTSKPRVKVSWEVKAVRNDRWVKAAGYRDEVEKAERDKGRYLEPSLYGFPEEMRIGSHAASIRQFEARTQRAGRDKK